MPVKGAVKGGGLSSEKVPVLSFFSGAGFLDIGFLRTNSFHIPWHNECHMPFVRAYEYGIPRLGYNTGSEKIQNKGKIQHLAAKSIVKEAFGGKKPSLFGIIGGPPCPDFSRAGKNNGGDGKNGVLTRKFADTIMDLHPTFFLMENVPGLLETAKHRMFLFDILRDLGGRYAVDLKVLNALEYGVPQNRRRVFVVGFCRKYLSAHPECADVFAKSENIISLEVGARNSRELTAAISQLHWFDWPRPKPKYKDALSRFRWNKRKGVADEPPAELTVSPHLEKTRGHINAGDVFRPYSDKFKTVEEGDTSRKSFKRLHRNGYSPNVAYGNNEVHLHPTENRRLSVAEALALQTVPSKYAFPDGMTLTDKFKAIGNGVPVTLAEQVASALAHFIEKQEEK